MDKDLEKVKGYIERRLAHAENRMKLIDDSDIKQRYAEGYWESKVNSYENLLEFVEGIMSEKKN